MPEQCASDCEYRYCETNRSGLGDLHIRFIRRDSIESASSVSWGETLEESETHRRRVIYFFLQSIDLPPVVVYCGTTVTGILVGGSSLYVVCRSIGTVDSVGESSGESAFTRVTEVIGFVSVLSAVMLLLSSIGGTGLTILARLGGPDPKTADGDLLRNRLLNWAQETREFMRNNGNEKLPLRPRGETVPDASSQAPECWERPNGKTTNPAVRCFTT